jgi:hypothetical protein
MTIDDDSEFKEVVKEEGETMLLQADGTRGKDDTIDRVGATNLLEQQGCDSGRST